MHRLPVQRSGFSDRLDRELRGGLIEKEVSARKLQACHLGIDGGIRRLVGLLRNDRHPAGKPGLEALDVVSPEVRVLVEGAGLCLGMRLEQVLRKNASFRHEGRLKSDSPGEILGISESRPPAGNEQLRYLSL